jgi:serine phosphatase RsbU (regulator of sigma subunit)/CHASE3 domain sensor protein
MRMSLRWKIVGGYGLLLMLIAVLGWVTLTMFGSLRSVQRDVFDEAIPQLEAVNEIVRSYTAQSAAVRGFLISSNAELLQQYSSEVATARTWQAEAKRLLSSRRDRRLLQDLVAAGQSFQRLINEEVIARARKGKRTQAFRILGQDGAPLISEIEVLGNLLQTVQKDKVAAGESELQQNSSDALVTLLLVTIGALLIGVLLAVLLPGRLVANISRLVEATRAIGRGDFDQRVEIHSGDEVEELAERLDEMQDGLKRLRTLAYQERELEIAASIQQNLLQRSLPDAPGAKVWPLQRQANLVGGDWYDVGFSGKTLTVVIGDASGKGVGAALMATVALTVLRAERSLGTGPKRVIEKANQALKEATAQDSFTTLVYLTIDVYSGEVRWINMGHPSPFLLQCDGDDGQTGRGYYLEGPRNRALGWFDDPGLAETVIQLRPGDRLVLFTDGFLEAKAPSSEAFGEHRLAQGLSRLSRVGSSELGEQLVQEVELFAAGKLDDDLTMLVTEFYGSEASPDGRTGVAEASTEV